MSRCLQREASLREMGAGPRARERAPISDCFRTVREVLRCIRESLRIVREVFRTVRDAFRAIRNFFRSLVRRAASSAAMTLST